jgi:deoxyribodipyrimidine photolyase
MPSRSVRRRKHKQLRRIRALDEQQRQALAQQLLSKWRDEARRRAKLLHAPAVWPLTTDPHIGAIIRELDQTGNLLADLRRICAEAIAEVANSRVVRS